MKNKNLLLVFKFCSIVLGILILLFPYLIILGSVVGMGYLKMLILPYALSIYVASFCLYKVIKFMSLKYCITGIIASLVNVLTCLFEDKVIELTLRNDGSYSSLGGHLDLMIYGIMLLSLFMCIGVILKIIKVKIANV